MTDHNAAQDLDNPVQKNSKPSKLSKILHNLGPKEKEQSHTQKDVPPALREQIKIMEERKAAKLEEMEKEGKKPNEKTSMSYVFDNGTSL